MDLFPTQLIFLMKDRLEEMKETLLLSQKHLFVS
jgi:hypothetical protein